MIGIMQVSALWPIDRLRSRWHLRRNSQRRLLFTPISDRDASDMVRSIRGYRLLQGFRGGPPGDIAPVEDPLLRVSRLVEELPEVVELDLIL